MEEEKLLLERILDGAEDPTNLSLALLQHITDNFSEDMKIGQGGFAAVYKGVFRQRIVAVKKIEKIDIEDKLYDREFKSMWKNNHENVVRFLGLCSNTCKKPIETPEGMVFAEVRERLFCFEYISGGSLDKHLADELRGFEWETRYKIILGICRGLCYLHEKNIVHMDLKPANILLDLDNCMVPKITDFGLSRPNTNSNTVAQPVGTRGYIAPEYWKDGRTTPTCDIYSLGAIIMELVTGDMEITNKHNVLRRWIHRWNNPPTPIQYQQVTGCIDIAVRCREEKPGARPSIKEIVDLLSERTDWHTGQAKKRKIIESASGKGKNKVGSSENAEATFMDIISSLLGQFTAQTEQCNLHTLQSFSRHYPTNNKYLGDRSRAVGSTSGAMGSLLDKLGKLVMEDYHLDPSIKKDIESFSEDLRNMHRDLPKLENVNGAKDWVDDVREMSYHIEDMVDCFLVHVEHEPHTGAFRELNHEGLNLLVNGIPSHNEIDDVITEIKNQVQAVAHRQKKYNLDIINVVANSATKAPIDPRISGIYIDREQIIGIKAPRDKVIRVLQDDGDASNKKLKIIFIVGMGGLGKTTLARAVYDEMKAHHTKAFIPVGQNPDVETLLKKIIRKFLENFNAKYLDMGELIEKLQVFLNDKRYITTPPLSIHQESSNHTI